MALHCFLVSWSMYWDLTFTWVSRLLSLPSVLGSICLSQFLFFLGFLPQFPLGDVLGEVLYGRHDVFYTEYFHLLCFSMCMVLALWHPWSVHYGDVIMGAIASQITSLTIVYSTVYSDADQRKHQSPASLAFAWGIQRGPVNSPHKWSVTRKIFPFDDVIMFFFYFTNSVCSEELLFYYEVFRC